MMIFFKPVFLYLRISNALPVHSFQKYANLAGKVPLNRSVRALDYLPAQVLPIMISGQLFTG
jgi:hypothetical protein